MNIQGISVLSSEVIMKPNWFGIFMIVLGIVLMLLGTLASDKRSWKKYSLQAEIIGFILFAMAAFTEFPLFYREDCIEYKCVINETASFLEVYEKFTVEDVEGKIWTIRTKGE